YKTVTLQVPDIRISQPPTPAPPKVSSPERTTEPPKVEISAVRRFLNSRGNSALADRVFRWLTVLCALSIFAIVLLILLELMQRSGMAWHKFGFKFFFQTPGHNPYTGQPTYWDPVNGDFSALPFVYGTLVSSFMSLLISVPLAVGLAIFLTEMCPG